MTNDRRDAIRKYTADVDYEVWRRGGNMDAVDRDRVSDDFYRGLSTEESARQFMPQPKHEKPSEEEWLENEGKQH